jgi:hypothetical protein
MRRRRLLLLGASVLPSLTMSVATPVSTALAATHHYVTVRPENFLSIFPGGDNRPASSYQFVVGPGDPPLGEGSIQLQTVDNAGKQQHLEYAQYGTPIAAITEMGYSTYKHADPELVAVAAINMEVNAPPAGYTTLVFEPYLNPQEGTIAPNTWQTWNGFTGNWWSTHPIPGVMGPRGTPVPWSAIVAANPNATVISYGINQGTFNPLTTSNVDALKIGLVGGDQWTYDFEPASCQEADGGGDFQGQQGQQGNVQMDNDSCEETGHGGNGDSNQGDRVDSSNRGNGTSFHSTKIESSNFDTAAHTVTITGLGTSDGIPVAFTLIALETGNGAPGWVSLVFSDGYSIAGNLLNGAISLS